MGGTRGFPVPAAAGAILLMSGKAPCRTAKGEAGRALQPGEPGGRAHRDRAGVVSREKQCGPSHPRGRVRHGHRLPRLLVIVGDVVVPVYTGKDNIAAMKDKVTL